MKIYNLLTIFIITILLLGSVNSNLSSNVFADDNSKKDNKEEKCLEIKIAERFGLGNHTN